MYIYVLTNCFKAVSNCQKLTETTNNSKKQIQNCYKAVENCQNLSMTVKLLQNGKKVP